MVIDWESQLPVILQQRDNGVSWADIAEGYGVSESAVRKGTKRRLEAKLELADNDHLADVDWPEEVDWRELLDTWELVNTQHKRMDPYQERFTLDFTRAKGPIAVASASDLHMGGGFTDHKAIRSTLEYILTTDNLYVGVSGDTIEGFIPGLKPAETVEQQAGSVKAQLHALDSLVRELTDEGKLLWLTWGDHDAKWFEQTVGYNIVKHMVHRKVPYFTGRGLVKVMVAEEEYYILTNHGERASSQWNLAHPSRRAYERFFPADVVITGHKHKPSFQMFTHYEELRRAGINLGGKAWLVVNGTYKTGPDPYTIRSWNRGVIGVPTIVFDNTQHDVDVFESPVKAMQYLGGV